MYQFFESILLENGKVPLLAEHQQRVGATFSAFYIDEPIIDLKKILEPIHLPNRGTFKIRISYDATNYNVDIYPYTAKQIRFLKAVSMPSNVYQYKFENRQPINDLFKKKDKADDVLISVDGLITDTSYANVILEKKGKLYTPKKPLLEGVRLAHISKKQKIERTEIAVTDIPEFDRLYLVNAMLAMGEQPPVPVTRIFLPKSN